MDNLYYKVKLYLEANSKSVDEFNKSPKTISLEDHNDGQGARITFWNVDGLTKPTDSQLNALASNATKEYNNVVIRQTRKAAYGNIGDQLDLLYKDMLAGKGDSTGEWFKSIKAVKDANPKEE